MLAPFPTRCTVLRSIFLRLCEASERRDPGRLRATASPCVPVRVHALVREVFYTRSRSKSLSVSESRSILALLFAHRRRGRNRYRPRENLHFSFLRLRVSPAIRQPVCLVPVTVWTRTRGPCAFRASREGRAGGPAGREGAASRRAVRQGCRTVTRAQDCARYAQPPYRGQSCPPRRRLARAAFGGSGSPALRSSSSVVLVFDSFADEEEDDWRVSSIVPSRCASGGAIFTSAGNRSRGGVICLQDSDRSASSSFGSAGSGCGVPGTGTDGHSAGARARRLARQA